jgi:hypothetical protein
MASSNPEEILMARDDLVKIHLIPRGTALPICGTQRREGGYQATTSVAEFKKFSDDGRCLKCAATMRKILGDRS